MKCLPKFWANHLLVTSTWQLYFTWWALYFLSSHPHLSCRHVSSSFSSNSSSNCYRARGSYLKLCDNSRSNRCGTVFVSHMKYNACWENTVCSKDSAGFGNVIGSLQFAISSDCTFQWTRSFGSLSSHYFLMFTGILCYNIGYIIPIFFSPICRLLVWWVLSSSSSRGSLAWSIHHPTLLGLSHI